MRRMIVVLQFGLLTLSRPMLSSAFAHEDESVSVEAPERIVRLVDGAFYRGELLEYVPKSHVILRLSSGGERRFDWKQIRSVETIQAAPRPTSAAASGARSVPVRSAAPVESSPESPDSEKIRAADLDRRSASQAEYSAHLNLGEAAYSRGLYTEAIKQFKAAYQAKPDLGLRYELARA